MQDISQILKPGDLPQAKRWHVEPRSIGMRLMWLARLLTGKHYYDIQPQKWITVPESVGVGKPARNTIFKGTKSQNDGF